MALRRLARSVSTATFSSGAGRSQARHIGAVLLGCAACAPVLFVVFIVGIALSFVLGDDERIEAHLRLAVAKGTLSRISYPDSPYEDGGLSYDMFTECVSLGVNLSNQGDGVLRRIAATPFVAPSPAISMREVQPCGDLIDALDAGDVRAERTYLRFWHGYQAYQRPLLTFTTLENMRRITAILLYSAMIFLSYRVALWFGPWAWPAVLLPFFVVGDFFTVPIVTSHAIPLTWIFLSAGAAAVMLDHESRLPRLALPLFVFASGAITNFLSFLLNPPLAPTLMAFLVIASAYRSRSGPLLAPIACAIGVGALWFGGYFVAWIEKWAFAVAVLGPDTVAAEMQSASNFYDARSAISLLSSDLSSTVEIKHFLQATWHIMAQDLHLSSHSKLIPYTLVSWVVAGAILAFAAATRRLTLADVARWLLMLTPLLAVVLWFEATRADSSIHAGFVYRSFLLFPIFPVLAALLIARQTRGRPQGAASLSGSS
jgi:hypothetical protein